MLDLAEMTARASSILQHPDSSYARPPAARELLAGDVLRLVEALTAQREEEGFAVPVELLPRLTVEVRWEGEA